MSVEVHPLALAAEVQAGDDLVSLLAEPLRRRGVRSGDVVAVTQKVVSKAEGRVVAADGVDWVAEETRRVVARGEDLVIAETRHGFVCANAGVDFSNVEAGFVSLLPEDPDASAEELRGRLSDHLGEPLAVVITDTFGRAWRNGVVNVAIGCAGLPALVDLRGDRDHLGRPLSTTVVALADEVAAASGLVMPKAGRVPASLVRGIAVEAKATAGRASQLVRSREEDLFRESPLVAISARRTIRAFGGGAVPRRAVEEAARAACTAPAPHHTRPWLFVAIDSDASKRRLLGAMAEAWVEDLKRDAMPRKVIERRLAKSDAVLGTAPMLIVPAIRLAGAHAYADGERAGAERDMFVLSGGAAIQSLLLALHAQGLASCWISSALFCQPETRAALGLPPEWLPMGVVAVGRPPKGEPEPRPALELGEHLRFA
jgi:dehydro coenzyme F420 reductase / coenzyme F420-0:L-glutamate ligase / coenzyme F420-1:gamma-L-glutamate ligase